MIADDTPRYLPRFNDFLKFRGDDCFILDYGCGVVSYKTLCSLYGNTYFAVIESNQKLKVFYFRGSQAAFEERCEILLRMLFETTALRLWTIGYVPALFTKDFSKDELADAIRLDFLKWGCHSGLTGDNLLGMICNENLATLNHVEFNAARILDFDFTRWIMRERKKILKEFKKQTKNM